MIKPALSYQKQLELLKSRGLIVPDESLALHVLAHHNYYRLSAFRFSYLDPGVPDQFKPGTTFTQIWSLYNFDRLLRQLILESCKRFEISVRSRWAYELGNRLGPLAYLENSHYADPLIHAKTLLSLDSEMNRSKEDFVKHHRHTLGLHWPPCWALAEVASFGNISTIITQHKDPSFRQAIANSYFLDEKIFCSVMHHLTVLRNTAAHHSRLWNRRFALTMQLPKKKPAGLYVNFNQTFSPTRNPKERRIYNSLVILTYLVQVIESESTWPKRLVELILTLDPDLLGEMEIPPDWLSLPLWKGLK